MRTGNGMIIDHPAIAFLEEAFSDSIDTDKQLYDPEKAYPGFMVRVFYSHVKHKDGSTYI